MNGWIVAAVAGVVAGAAASLVMDVYQRVSAPAFGIGGDSDSEPATAKAADSATELVEGRPVPKKDQGKAGALVHYLTGTGAGLVYALVAPHWPPITIGFGIAYGLALAVVLDNLLVPLFGWSGWAWQASLGENLYGLSSHVVFGAVLELVRRGGMAVLG